MFGINKIWYKLAYKTIKEKQVEIVCTNQQKYNLLSFRQLNRHTLYVVREPNVYWSGTTNGWKKYEYEQFTISKQCVDGRPQSVN